MPQPEQPPQHNLPGIDSSSEFTQKDQNTINAYEEYKKVIFTGGYLETWGRLENWIEVNGQYQPPPPFDKNIPEKYRQKPVN